MADLPKPTYEDLEAENKTLSDMLVEAKLALANLEFRQRLAMAKAAKTIPAAAQTTQPAT